MYLAEVFASVLVQLPDLPSPPSALFPSLRLGEYLGKIAYESKYAATVHLLQETPHPVKVFSQSVPRIPVEMLSEKHLGLKLMVF